MQVYLATCRLRNVGVTQVRKAMDAPPDRVLPGYVWTRPCAVHALGSARATARVAIDARFTLETQINASTIKTHPVEALAMLTLNARATIATTGVAPTSASIAGQTKVNHATTTL